MYAGGKASYLRHEGEIFISLRELIFVTLSTAQMLARNGENVENPINKAFYDAGYEVLSELYNELVEWFNYLQVTDGVVGMDDVPTLEEGFSKEDLIKGAKGFDGEDE